MAMLLKEKIMNQAKIVTTQKVRISIKITSRGGNNSTSTNRIITIKVDLTIVKLPWSTKKRGNKQITCLTKISKYLNILTKSVKVTIPITNPNTRRKRCSNIQIKQGTDRENTSDNLVILNKLKAK
jgi:hypothetical protein